MDPETALTLQVVRRFAAHLLPGAVLTRFEPQLDQAAAVLASLEPEAGMRAWPERIRVLPRALGLKAPSVADEVVDAVYEALLTGHRLAADYRSRVHGGETKSYVINPLGLVFRDQVVYLVATLWDYEDIRHLALHRFETARCLDELRIEPSNFDLDAYIAQGYFDYRESGSNLALRLRFNREAAYHLYETPISDDQQLTETDDGAIELAATVNDTAQLRWWLLGFGASVVVTEPVSLREEIRSELERGLNAYGA